MKRILNTGWENLPNGWDEDSLENFAQSLTGQEGEEGFLRLVWTKWRMSLTTPKRFALL
jgi:uncharacterized protein YifE (UPF0438 family)